MRNCDKAVREEKLNQGANGLVKQHFLAPVEGEIRHQKERKRGPKEGGRGGKLQSGGEEVKKLIPPGRGEGPIFSLWLHSGGYFQEKRETLEDNRRWGSTRKGGFNKFEEQRERHPSEKGHCRS